MVMFIQLKEHDLDCGRIVLLVKYENMNCGIVLTVLTV